MGSWLGKASAWDLELSIPSELDLMGTEIKGKEAESKGLDHGEFCRVGLVPSSPCPEVLPPMSA